MPRARTLTEVFNRAGGEQRLTARRLGAQHADPTLMHLPHLSGGRDHRGAAFFQCRVHALQRRVRVLHALQQPHLHGGVQAVGQLLPLGAPHVRKLRERIDEPRDQDLRRAICGVPQHLLPEDLVECTLHRTARTQFV